MMGSDLTLALASANLTNPDFRVTSGSGEPDKGTVGTGERTARASAPTRVPEPENSDHPQTLEERRAAALARVIRLEAFVRDASKEIRARNFVLPKSPSYRL